MLKLFMPMKKIIKILKDVHKQNILYDFKNICEILSSYTFSTSTCFWYHILFYLTSIILCEGNVDISLFCKNKWLLVRLKVQCRRTHILYKQQKVLLICEWIDKLINMASAKLTFVLVVVLLAAYASLVHMQLPERK